MIDPVFIEAVKRAADDLQIKWQLQYVSLQGGEIRANQFEEFVRAYSGMRKERFESIPAGSYVEFDVRLSECHLEPSDYAAILSAVGKFYGLSQWGNKFGMGRFKVDSIKRVSVAQTLDLDFVLDVDE